MVDHDPDRTREPGGPKKPKKLEINLEDLEDVQDEIRIGIEDLPDDEATKGVSTTRRGVDGLPTGTKRVQLRYCPRCKRPNPAGNRFCSSCGSEVKPQPPSQEFGGRSRRRSGKLFSRLLILILVPAALIIAGVLLYGAIFGEREVEVDYITVPGDYSSIQEAINAAQEGEEIVVAPGVYYENIDFRGKNIYLRSEDPGDARIVAQTVINGGRNGPVVTFSSGEGPDAAILGFTITRGSGARETIAPDEAAEEEAEEEEEKEAIVGVLGGGILVLNNSTPHIHDNVIEGNLADYGAGIAVYGAAPSIVNNRITNNGALVLGGGIFLTEAQGVTLNGNVVTDNEAGEAGGAIWADDPLLLPQTVREDNVIVNNRPDDMEDYYLQPDEED